MVNIKKFLVLLSLIVMSLSPQLASASNASWYGPGFHGKLTASGARYNMNALTAAHKTLPFGSKVEVTNLKNNKSVIVNINDRGPFIKGRVIDLSKKANQLISCDLCKVQVKVLSRGDTKYRLDK